MRTSIGECDFFVWDDSSSNPRRIHAPLLLEMLNFFATLNRHKNELGDLREPEWPVTGQRFN